jgi:hypothetical protein
LTALFNPKSTDCFDHCLPPIDDTPLALFHSSGQ